MRRLPEELLEEHGVQVVGQNGGLPEPGWQQVLRLNQSLWRQEQGLAAKPISAGFLGSCLAAEPAAAGRNLLSEAALVAAEREARDARKLIDIPRLRENLLTSQALCFSIFAELQEDLGAAGKVIGALLGRDAEVTRVELEHSPGRGDLSYTGDYSAADAYVEYVAKGRRGFLCVEVKYFEALDAGPTSKDHYRPRYSEVASAMGCFRDGAEAALRQPPLEQLWRDHLLAGSILQHPAERMNEGSFVLLHPTLNQACADAASAYRACLTDDAIFRVWTLESFVDALLVHGRRDCASALKDRYLDYSRVDRAYRDHYLKQTTRWANTLRADLGALQAREGHRVWFRPSSSGFGMVGLLPEKPQLGTRYTSMAKLLRDFETEFTRHCDGPAPRRATPEKRLQSHLVADALRHGRRMRKLDEALIFLTDELVFPGIGGDQRLDILALRPSADGARLVLIELKSARLMTELLHQTRTYAAFLDEHAERLAALAGAILGEPVVLAHPSEKWIVWPAPASAGPDPKIAELGEAGVRVATYREGAGGFEIDVGVRAGSYDS